MLLMGLTCNHAFSQSLFESAEKSADTENGQKVKITAGGFARGSVYAGGETYDLTNTFAEFALQASLEKESASLKADIRLRKGVNFNESYQQIQVKELYAGYKSRQFDVLLGDQIVNWGRADGFNPTDNLNSKDYFFFSSDPDDQLQSNFMLRMKYRIIPEIEVDLVGIPYYAMSNYRYDLFDLGDQVFFGKDILPSGKLKNGTMAARINFDFPGAGWAFSWFRGYDPYHGFSVQDIDWSSGTPAITNISKAYRKTTIGADFSIPAGDIIIRGEAAYDITENPENQMYIPLSDISYVGGIEFNIANITTIFQYIGKYTPDFTELPEPVLSNPIDPTAQFQYANEMIAYENRMFNRKIFNQQEKTNHAFSLTLSRSFNYDIWNASCTGYYNITSGEWLVRPKLTWKVSDALSVAIGGNYMEGKDKTLFSYSSSLMNGAFAELKINF